jgi:hypothetical protein
MREPELSDGIPVSFVQWKCHSTTNYTAVSFLFSSHDRMFRPSGKGGLFYKNSAPVDSGREENPPR